MHPRPLLSGGVAASDAARDARRFLVGRVRNDWHYPSTGEPGPQSTLSNVTLASHTLENQLAGQLLFEPISWQERAYSSDDSGQSASDSTGTKQNTSSTKSAAKSSDIAKKESRKRKREQMLEEEMVWNTGLAHFVGERNAWTCARLPSTTLASPPAHVNGATLGRSSDDSLNQSTISTPASSPPSMNEPGPSDMHVMLPIPEPILQDNPVRAKIKPDSYNEIYSKIILQARSPTVPINLGDITKACVRGWIAEGNWPPKPGPPDPLLGRARRKAHPRIRKGVEAVGRVFGLGTSEAKEK